MMFVSQNTFRWYVHRNTLMKRISRSFRKLIGVIVWQIAREHFSTERWLCAHKFLQESASLDLCYHLIANHNSLSRNISRVYGDGDGGDDGGGDGDCCSVCVRFVRACVRACVRHSELKMTPRRIHEDGLAIVAKVKLIAQAVIEQVDRLYT